MKNYSGMKNNMLTAIMPMDRNKYNRQKWLFKCDCGNYYVSTPDRVFKPNHPVKSCGCLNDKQRKSGNNRRTHGKHDTRLYRIWQAMKNRCYNKNAPDYQKWYGGRGIKMCDEWKNNFLSFYEWSINNGYSDELSIDRINYNGDYEPSNCRWATTKEQANNTKGCRNIEYNGETHTMMEWSEILGINYWVINTRLNTYKWSVERAFTQPVKRRTKPSKALTDMVQYADLVDGVENDMPSEYRADTVKESAYRTKLSAINM